MAGLESNANKYIHPATHPASMITEATDKHFLTDAERAKLSGIDVSKYVTREEVLALLPRYLEIFVDQAVLALTVSSSSGITINGGTKIPFESYIKISVTQINSLELMVAPDYFTFTGLLEHTETASKNLTLNTTVYGSYKITTGGPFRSGIIRISKK